MPWKLPLPSGTLRSVSRYRIVWYFALGILVPGVIMGILAFRGIRNDQALAEREQRSLAMQQAATIVDSTESLLDHRAKAFQTILAQTSVSEGGFDTILSEFVQWYPELIAVYRLTPARVIIAAGHLQYIPDEVHSNEYRSDLHVAPEPALGWTFEYQQENLGQALDLYIRMYQHADQRAVRAMACNVLARISKKQARYEEAIRYYEVMRDSFADFQLTGAIPLGLTANAELCTLYRGLGHFEKSAGVLVELLRDLTAARWVLRPTIYSLFVQKAREIYVELDSLRAEVPAGLMQEIERIRSERMRAEQLTDRQLDVFHYLSDHRTDLLATAYDGQHRKQSYDANGMPCVLTFAASTNDTLWVLMASTPILVQTGIEPWSVHLSSSGRWEWSVRDERQPAGARTVSLQDHNQLEVRLPSYLPHLTLVGTSRPVSFVGSMLRSGRGGYLYIFLFIGAMFITGLLFVTYSINRELQLTKMKSEFVATVSHEFKSPLTAIRQIAEMFQEGRVPEEKRDTYYDVMLQQGMRLTQLIDNVLDFSRIEQGMKKYRLRKTDVAAIVRQSVERSRQRHGSAGIDITLDVREPIPETAIDPEAIAQVMDNLLDNAVKYSGASTQVNVELSAGNGVVRGAVRDFGIGIPENDHQRVFERFYRVESDQHRHLKGSGIGLHLVREIIGSHGGTVWIDSTEGEGTTVRFELPINRTDKND